MINKYINNTITKNLLIFKGIKRMAQIMKNDRFWAKL